MAIDYAEKEREFLDGLAADTGRDLSQWMAEIRDSGLTDRNEIIDWLRQQGFLFAKASWLERVHHNGGRPVYGASAPASPLPGVLPAAPLQPAPPSVSQPPPTPPAQPAAIVQAASRAPASSQPAERAVGIVPAVETQQAATYSGTLDSLLSEAKGYRPLAQFVLREIQARVPAATFAARAGYVSLSSGHEFAILSVSPRELRLALACPGLPVSEPYSRARFPKTHPDVPAGLTHMCVLTDARQVTDALLDAVVAAAQRA